MSHRWKIVATDNFARETVADHLVGEVYCAEETAKGICDLLNKDRFRGDRWYVVKPHDYKLWGGMSELV